MPSPTEDHPLVRKLKSTTELAEDEVAALLRLPLAIVDIRANQDIVRQGDRPSRSALLIEGLAWTYSLTRKGKAQVMAVHVPGAIPDLQSLHLTVMDCNLGTITPCRFGFIEHSALRAICAQFPGVSHALWRETLIEAAIYRQWMVGLGQQVAYSRMAHFFCEHMVRMRAVGLAVENTCSLPMSQSRLGEILGLTAVHVNRTLQELRHDKLLSFEKGQLVIFDWPRLTKAGDFDSYYLQLRHTGNEPESL
jgi:CRP-like cAMP-binding protein